MNLLRRKKSGIPTSIELNKGSKDYHGHGKPAAGDNPSKESPSTRTPSPMETSGLDDESATAQALAITVNGKPLLEIYPEAKAEEVQTFLNSLQRGINDKVVGSESGADGADDEAAPVERSADAKPIDDADGKKNERKGKNNHGKSFRFLKKSLSFKPPKSPRGGKNKKGAKNSRVPARQGRKERANGARDDGDAPPGDGPRRADAPPSPEAEAARGRAAANDATRAEEIAKAREDAPPEAPIEEAAASAEEEEEEEAPAKDDEGAAPATEGEAAAPAEERRGEEEEEEDDASPPAGTDSKEEEEGGGTEEEEESAPPAKGAVDDDDPARRGAEEGASQAPTRGGDDDDDDDDDAAPPAEGAARAAEGGSSVDAPPGGNDTDDVVPLVDGTPTEDGSSSAAKDETESCRAVACDDDATDGDECSWDDINLEPSIEAVEQNDAVLLGFYQPTTTEETKKDDDGFDLSKTVYNLQLMIDGAVVQTMELGAQGMELLNCCVSDVKEDGGTCNDLVVAAPRTKDGFEGGGAFPSAAAAATTDDAGLKQEGSFITPEIAESFHEFLDQVKSRVEREGRHAETLSRSLLEAADGLKRRAADSYFGGAAADPNPAEEDSRNDRAEAGPAPNGGEARRETSAS